jgi:hypothetical protein
MAYPPSEADDRSSHILRLAIISTPRSGNTWLRRLLATAFGLSELGGHRPEDLDRSPLPVRCVLQMHWHPEPSFVERLVHHRFRVMALARHPLDVLISALNFNYYAHNRASCRNGESCPECSMLGATPRSRAFLRYSCGGDGRYLLSFTPAWWQRSDVIQVRYEALVADTLGELERVVQLVGFEPQVPLPDAIAKNTLEGLRIADPAHAYHFWQGQPGIWRSLLPMSEAHVIAAANSDVLERLGYDCDPDPTLDGDRADASWSELLLSGARTHYGAASVAHPASRQALIHAREQLAFALDALATTLAEVHEARRLLAANKSHDDSADAADHKSAGAISVSPRGWRIHDGLASLFRGLSRREAVRPKAPPPRSGRD